MVAAPVSETDSRLIVVAGPTAAGKTALSLQLAEELGGEIVSCDSVAVYRGMEIGTAKPSGAERARVPHHMLDVVTPDVPYTAGDYGRAARTAIAAIAARGHVPIVTGGSGLYLRALLEGLSAIPGRNKDIRQRLNAAAERRGAGLLHRLLRRLDAGAAGRIHANDAPKLIRAIEVSVLERKPVSAAWVSSRPEPLTGFRVVQIGLEPDRAALYDRINRRCAAMFADGLIAETADLVERYGVNCRALHALGYAEAQAVLRGELSREQAVSRTQAGHRQYSKRQRTWFRRDLRITWLSGFGDAVVSEAKSLIQRS